MHSFFLSLRQGRVNLSFILNATLGFLNVLSVKLNNHMVFVITDILKLDQMSKKFSKKLKVTRKMKNYFVMGFVITSLLD